MNIIDLLIIAVLAFGFLWGWYKGFFVSVLNIAAFFVSWIGAFIFYGPLSSFINAKTNLATTLLYYTAGAEKLSDMTVANVNVANLTADRISEIIHSSNLPGPIAQTMEENILKQAFLSSGITTLSDYFNQTIINLSMNLISFIIIYFAIRIIALFVIGLVDNIFSLPVLKQADSVIGGAFGVLQGVMLVFILFSIFPIAMSVLPLEKVNNLIQSSLLGRLFLNGNIIFNVLRSVIK